jgi:hypothetical protein
MATQEQELLDRISTVYGESKKLLPFNDKMAGKMNEIAETRTLYFNPFYPGGRLGKLGKKIFQKMTRPMLTKQVEFNTSVRDILIQISTAITAIEVNLKRALCCSP